jgi:membrane protease YdiL (CAAX protease family)
VAIWYILWLFGLFFPFWYVVPRKIWQPWFLLLKAFIGIVEEFFLRGSIAQFFKQKSS